MESILTSIKKLLGIAEEYTHFDNDIIMHINSVFMTLNQLGIGPTEGFSIEDESAVWTDYIPEAEFKRIEPVKTYIYMKVRLAFDTPSSTVISALNTMIAETESRLLMAVETPC